MPRSGNCSAYRGAGWAGPLWVDAPAFDLADHVRIAPLSAPRDEAALLVATEQLLRQRQDRSRPLWEMWFLPGLRGNQVGLVVKVHHAIAGVATIGAFLDAGRSVSPSDHGYVVGAVLECRRAVTR